MFSKKDFGLLKTMSVYMTVPELMALWEIYLARSPFWGPNTGFLIHGFFQERSVLLDDSKFKPRTLYFEKLLGMKVPQEVFKEFDLPMAKSL